MFISPKFQLRPGRAHKTVLRFSQLKPQKDNKPVERAGLSLFFIFGGRLIETTINPARSEHVVQIKHVVERFFFQKRIRRKNGSWYGSRENVECHVREVLILTEKNAEQVQDSSRKNFLEEKKCWGYWTRINHVKCRRHLIDLHFT